MTIDRQALAKRQQLVIHLDQLHFFLDELEEFHRVEFFLAAVLSN